MASAEEIPPGGEGQILVTIPGNLKGGPIEKSVWVHANDKTLRRFKLRLRANVRTALGADPKAINFGKLKLGEMASRTVKIMGYARDEIKVNKVVCNDPNLTVTLNENDLRVDVLARKIGKIDTSVMLETDFVTKKIISVLKVSGQILGPIAVNPELIEVPQLAEGETYKKTLTITSKSDMFKITGLRTSREGPRFSVETVEEGRAYNVYIEFLANRPQNQLYITTDYALQPTLVVRIYGP